MHCTARFLVLHTLFLYQSKKYLWKICLPRKHAQNPRVKYLWTQCKTAYLQSHIFSSCCTEYSTSVLLWSINSYLKASKQTNKQKFWSFLTLKNSTFWTLETLDEDLTTMLLQCSHSKSSCYGNWGISNWQDKFCPHILCWPYIKHSGLFHE